MVDIVPAPQTGAGGACRSGETVLGLVERFGGQAFLRVGITEVVDDGARLARVLHEDAEIAHAGWDDHSFHISLIIRLAAQRVLEEGVNQAFGGPLMVGDRQRLVGYVRFEIVAIGNPDMVEAIVPQDKSRRGT